jgi:DNA-binding NarL/FixJ family response regulator/tetratricopeptide (TPR) repeat protein
MARSQGAALKLTSTTGLVGRDRQLAALRGVLDLAGRGDGGVALVRGDAGTGKSRLVAELIDAARHDHTAVLAGGCVAVGGEPLRHAALIELVRAAGTPGPPARAAGLRGPNAEAGLRGPNAEAGSGERAARRDDQPVVGIAGLTSEAVLEHLLALLDRLLARGTVLVVVEDLHWADRGTCEILSVLARHAAHRRLAVVVTCRDDELPHGHLVRNVMAELGRGPRATGIELGPLSAAEVARLVEHLAGALPATTAASLYDRSGGNPLLVEELCSVARDRQREGRDIAEPPAGALRDILIARWAGLAEDPRAAVSAAAVAGAPVTVEQVAAVLGWEPRATAAAVRTAVDRHVLAIDRDRVAFRHAVTAEAVYRELLPAERTWMHARWAAVLTGLPPDEADLGLRVPPAGPKGTTRTEDGTVLDLVAATEAYEVAPRVAHHWDAADRPAPAFVAALRAAEGALATLAVETARHHYAAALALWPRVPDAAGRFGGRRLDLCRTVAEMANLTDDATGAVAAIDDALRDPDAAEPATASVLHERRGWYLLRQGAIDDARAAYEQALALLPADAPAATRAAVMAGAVRTYERTGRWDQALDLAQGAVAEGRAASEAAPGLRGPNAEAGLRGPNAEAGLRGPNAEAGLRGPNAEAGSGPAPQEVNARYMLGRVLLVTGANEEAAAELGRAAEASEQIDDPVGLTVARREQADALARLGRFAEAVVTAAATASRLRARHRVDPDALLVEALLGAYLYRLGRFAELRTVADRLLADATTPVTRALGQLTVGLMDLEDLRIDAARERLELARFLAAPLLDGRINGYVATGRAELALAEGNIDAARAAVDEGIGAVRHSGDDEVLAHLALLGLRVERAAAARAAGRESPGVLRRREQRRAELEAGLATVLAVPPAGADRPDLDAVERAWRAEVDEDAEPAVWQQVEADWDALGWARWAAYAAIRRVEATARAVRATRAGRSGEPGATAAGDAGSIEKTLSAALAAAETRIAALGSAVLRAELAALAQRIGHTIDEPAETRVAPAGVGTGSPPDEGLARLTKRELEVLDLVAGGATNRQIAERLFISEKTASVHVSRILTKLGAVDRREASALARRSGRH